MQPSQPITFFIPSDSNAEIPFASSGIKAGFPSPAGDYIEESIDLNKFVIKNKSATFYARVDGSSMAPILSDGDLIVIDRSLTPNSNDIALCYIDGGFTVKTIQKTPNALYLIPANKAFEPIEVTPDNDFIIWGVITFSIRKHR
jgi:DNA polymerase V